VARPPSPATTAVGQAAGLDSFGEAQCQTPVCGMREQQRMTRRVAHDCRKRAGRLGLGGNNLVIDRARSELDAIPPQPIGGHQLDEPRHRQLAQLRHGRASPVKRHQPVRAPGLAGQALPSGLGCLALVFGQASLVLAEW
jgi:hypothetical protein